MPADEKTPCPARVRLTASVAVVDMVVFDVVELLNEVVEAVWVVVTAPSVWGRKTRNHREKPAVTRTMRATARTRFLIPLLSLLPKISHGRRGSLPLLF